MKHSRIHDHHTEKMLAGKGRNAPPVIDEAAKSKLCSPMTVAALSSKISTDAQQVAHLPHTSSQAGRSWHQADSSYLSTLVERTTAHTRGVKEEKLQSFGFLRTS